MLMLQRVVGIAGGCWPASLRRSGRTAPAGRQVGADRLELSQPDAVPRGKPGGDRGSVRRCVPGGPAARHRRGSSRSYQLPRPTPCSFEDRPVMAPDHTRGAPRRSAATRRGIGRPPRESVARSCTPASQSGGSWPGIDCSRRAGSRPSLSTRGMLRGSACVRIDRGCELGVTVLDDASSQEAEACDEADRQARHGQVGDAEIEQRAETREAPA